MKRFFLAVSIVAFLLLALTGNAQTGFLKTSGKKILDANGQEVILRGMGMGGWMLQEGYMLETSDFAGTQHEIMQKIQDLVGEEATEAFYAAWRTNYCQKKDIDSMAAWGFNSIRLPMHYNLFTLPIDEEPVAGKDTWLETGFQMVDSLLDWCEANEIYLILDLHAAPGGQGKDANISDYDPSKPSLWESVENQRKTVALWKKLAERYASEPWIGGYDLLNEPNWDIDNAGNQNGCSCNNNTRLWNLYKEMISAVRSVDKNHIVIIEGNCWGNNYNGIPNPKSIDNNIVMSFHKYWSYNDQASISGIVGLGNTYNVPVWMGESGENSNTWFTNAIKLVESNGIGWAWWPYKKIGSVTGTVTIPKTAGWQSLLNYWSGSGAEPSVSQAKIWLMEQAEMLKLENCTIHRDVIDAMFRQINNSDPIPFKIQKAPGIVFAVNYDLGPNGHAFLDVDTANYKTTTGSYTAWNSGYAYRNDGVDIESCTDAAGTNGYSVGWTATGEWLLYTINIDKTAAYTIDLRYAAQGSAGKVHFELDGVSVTPKTTLKATGGWSIWGTNTTSNVVLKEGRHQLKLCIDNEGFNINYFRIYNPTEVGQVTPEIINIKTDSNGLKIILTSNVGFSSASEPAASEFGLKVNGSLRNIGSVYFHKTIPEVLVLETDEHLISVDNILLSYSGSSLKSPSDVRYSSFQNREVENFAPTYFLLPGLFQAEYFKVNNGFQLESCTDIGDGQNLGYANPGDYTDYDVYFSYSGTFRFDYRVASQSTGKFELRLVEDGNVTTLHAGNISATGGWQTWKTISYEIPMTAGKKQLRFYAVSGEFNLNWISVTTIAGAEKLSNENKIVAVFSSDSHSIELFSKGLEENVATVNCYTLSGQKVFGRDVEIEGNATTLSSVFLPDGIYLVQIKILDDFFVQRLRIH